MRRCTFLAINYPRRVHFNENFISFWELTNGPFDRRSTPFTFCSIATKHFVHSLKMPKDSAIKVRFCEMGFSNAKNGVLVGAKVVVELGDFVTKT